MIIYNLSLCIYTAAILCSCYYAAILISNLIFFMFVSKYINLYQNKMILYYNILRYLLIAKFINAKFYYIFLQFYFIICNICIK